MLMQRSPNLLDRKPFSSLLNIADQLVFPALLLLCSRFFIRSVGLENYGLWLLSFTLVSFAPAFALGVPDYLVRSLNLDHDPQEKNLELMASGTAVVLAAILVSGVLFLFARELALLVAGQEQYAPHLRLMALGVGLRMIDTYQQAVLQARENYGTSAFINIVVLLIIFGAVIYVVLHGGGVYEFIALSVMGWAVSCIIKFGLLLQGLSVAFRQVGFASMRLVPLLLESRAFWLQNVSSLSANYLDRLFVSGKLGLESLAIYTLATQVTVIVQMAVNKAFAVEVPRLVRASQQGTGSALKRSYYGLLFSSLILGGAACLGYAVFGADLSRLLLHGDAQHGTLFFLLGVHYSWLATSSAPFYVLNASGHAGANALLGLASSGISLLLGFLGVSLYGLSGLVTAKWLSWPVSFISRNYVHRVVLKDGGRLSFLRAFGPFALLVALALALRSLSLPWLLWERVTLFIAYSGVLALFLKWVHHRLNTLYPEESL